ncbi:hypothetical protein GW796_05525 [archaeon]|nr:hypothetical protein [archaeon]NCQ51344.1 hypothetical protein [archaeon]NCT58830.1 hypothetical protein [archaeon]
MAKYIVNAPDGKEVSVATPFGVQKFPHGSYMYDDRFHSVYPKYFIPVVEVNTEYIPTTKDEPVIKDEPKKVIDEKPVIKDEKPKKVINEKYKQKRQYIRKSKQ